MSTHKIGFYEDLTKIILELSSNIIKYAPYFFCWCFFCGNVAQTGHLHKIRTSFSERGCFNHQVTVVCKATPRHVIYDHKT